jgi:hypothetical protein
MRIALALFTLVCASAAQAAPKDMPARKPGLWEIKMQLPNMPQAMLSQHCIDDKTDNLLQQQGEKHAQQQCSKNSLSKQGDKIILDSVCQFDATTATTHAVFSGDFSRAYRGEISTTYAPPLHGMQSSKQVLEGKWLGACKPGQKPGDVVIPGMGSMNLNEMMKNIPNGNRPRTPH